jgi:hypothetical protein
VVVDDADMQACLLLLSMLAQPVKTPASARLALNLSWRRTDE